MTDSMHGHEHHAHEQHHEHRHAQAAPLPSSKPHAGHDKHAGHTVAMFRDRFALSLLLTLPTVIWGHMLPRLLGYAPPAFPGSHWVAPLLGTVVYCYGGWPFIQGAVRERRHRVPGMMTLIALAISVAFGFSLVVTLGYPGMPLWEELATLVTIMLLGHWIEMRSVQRAEGALAQLARLLPSTASRISSAGDTERIEEVPVTDLRAGDVVLVRPGASVPADGRIRAGGSQVNEAMITGESRPVDKRAGEAVIAGTVNLTGSLRVEVVGVGETTTLARIMRLVEQAQHSRSKTQALADRAAFWLTLIAIGAGSITLASWLLTGADVSYAVERTVTVLVIACPHALGLAIPLVVAISTTLGAQHGLLVRDRRGLEEARTVDTVVFDKTGTLTLADHRVVALRSVGGLADDDALRLAAAVEHDSEHPVAEAIVNTARARGLTVPPGREFRAMPGRGVEATVDGRRFAVGGPNLVSSSGVAVGPELADFERDAAAQGRATIYLIEGKRALAALAVADAIRPESPEAVQRLKQLGLEVALLTGDARPVAESVGRQLGIDVVLAEVLPEGKAATIEHLQQEGKRVAMVGDGVNDAPALVTADVGIAIGAGTDVAVDAGDVVLVRSDPRDIARIVQLSRVSYRKMVQNLWWAAGYNIVAIPLAAGALAGLGIVLSPAVGAVLMSLSTIIVAVNAQLLRRAPLH